LVSLPNTIVFDIALLPQGILALIKPEQDLISSSNQSCIRVFDGDRFREECSTFQLLCVAVEFGGLTLVALKLFLQIQAHGFENAH
jgi:hypothetical protein